jgi:atypical dual specificity phosphatase
MKFLAEKEILPAFPKTPHLPHKPNTDFLDKVATEQEVAPLWTQKINIEEKIDGSSCGMTIRDDEPLIRNRDHILRKGYHKKDSAAKMQFASVFNWWYENKARFKQLAEVGPYSVYGEWMIAQHGIHYTRLPDWFIAYDLFDQEKKIWVPPLSARNILENAGFTVPKLCFWGNFEGDYNDLEMMANLPAQWADSKAEGIYVKIADEKQTKILHRFKMVREDFVRGALWNPKELAKNGRAA